MRGCKIGQILPKKLRDSSSTLYRSMTIGWLISTTWCRHSAFDTYYSCLFRSQNSLTLPRIPRVEEQTVHLDDLAWSLGTLIFLPLKNRITVPVYYFRNDHKSSHFNKFIIWIHWAKKTFSFLLYTTHRALYAVHIYFKPHSFSVLIFLY